MAEFDEKGTLAKRLTELHQILKSYGCNPTTVQLWYFSTDEEHRAKLEQEGLQIISIDRFGRPTYWPLWISFPQSFFR